MKAMAGSPTAKPKSETAVNGLITYPSRFDHAHTLSRFLAGVKREGMTLIAHIDHAAAARRANFDIPACDLFIFGHPPVGSSLMRLAPTIAIDLPLKALIWRDEAGATWLSYNQPQWLAGRHGIAPDVSEIPEIMSATLLTIIGDVADVTAGEPR